MVGPVIILIYAGALLAVITLVLAAAELGGAAWERSRVVSYAEAGLADLAARRDLFSRTEVAFRRTRLGRRLSSELELAGLTVQPLMVFLAGAGFAVVTGWALWALLAPLLSAAGLLLGFLIVRAYLRRAQAWRREAIISQLPELARVLANASYAGLSLPTALAVAGEELAEPSKSELMRIATRIRFGSSVEQALQDFRERVKSREVGILVSTLVVSSRAGGSLVTALRSIADSLEQRKETRREIETTLSEPIVTSYFVIGMGFVMLFVVNALNPGTVDAMTRQPFGQLVLVVGFGLLALGFVLVRRMSRIDL